MTKINVYEWIKNGKIVRKSLTIISALAIAGSASGCMDESSKDNNNSQNSSISKSYRNDRKYDATKIKNNGTISEAVLADLYASSGLIDVMNGKYNLDEIKSLNANQKSAIYEIAEHLKKHLNASDKDSAKKELDEIIKAIGNFYGEKGIIETMNDILYNSLPTGSNITTEQISPGQIEFVNEKGIVSPISVVKNSLGYGNAIEASFFDHYSLAYLMNQGYACGTGEVSEELDNIVVLIHICKAYGEDGLKEFKDRNNNSYLGNKKMFADVLSYPGAYEAMLDGGIYDNFNVVSVFGGNFDVKVGNQLFYTINIDENETVVEELSLLNKKEISSDELKKNSLMDDVVLALPKSYESEQNKVRQKVV